MSTYKNEKFKVCFIDNMATHYRKGIFKLIDEEYDVEWFFGKPFGGIKELPINFLKKAEYLEIKKLPHHFYRQPGMSKLHRSEKYDVVFTTAEFGNLSLWWMMLLHRLFAIGPKVYYWTHGCLRLRKYPRRFFDKLFYSMADGIFTYGERARDVMVGMGLDGRKIFPIHNSLNYDEQIKLRGNFTDIYRNHFGNDRPVLFFIGRLTPVKKLDMLVRVVRKLKEKDYAVNLVLIGDGPERQNLWNLAKKLDIIENVWFYGPSYDEEEKSELIANADLCVAPGNIGLTAMDSLVYGTPVITMDNYGLQMPEHEAIKEGETGSFFKENDLQSLTDKIYDWLCKGQDRAQIRQNCYRKIDTDWNPKYQINVIKEHLNK